MSEIGLRIKEAVRALGMTQKEAADTTGITLRSMKNYLLGYTTPDAKVLQTICRRLDLAPLWLLFGEGEMFLAGETADGGLFPGEKSQLMMGFSALAEHRRDWIRSAQWVHRQIQAKDQSDAIFESIKGRGVNSELLGEIAAEKRNLESIEREILDAFLDAGRIDPDKLPEIPKAAMEGRKKRKKLLPKAVTEGTKRRKTLLPKAITDRQAEEGRVPVISERFESVLEKYAAASNALLERVQAQ